MSINKNIVQTYYDELEISNDLINIISQLTSAYEYFVNELNNREFFEFWEDTDGLGGGDGYEIIKEDSKFIEDLFEEEQDEYIDSYIEKMQEYCDEDEEFTEDDIDSQSLFESWFDDRLGESDTGYYWYLYGGFDPINDGAKDVFIQAKYTVLNFYKKLLGTE